MRNALYVEASFSEFRPEEAEQVQTTVELEPAEIEPAPLVATTQAIPLKSPELVRRVAISNSLQSSEVAVADVEVQAEEKTVQLALPQRQTKAGSAISATQSAESPKLPRRSTTAPATQSSAAVEETAGFDEKTPPSFSGNRPPSYPGEAIWRSLEGTVVLRLYISASGKVDRVEISQSSGHSILDREAVQTVSQWRGQPAQRGGTAVSSVEILPIHFRLSR